MIGFDFVIENNARINSQKKVAGKEENNMCKNETIKEFLTLEDVMIFGKEGEKFKIINEDGEFEYDYIIWKENGVLRDLKGTVQLAKEFFTKKYRRVIPKEYKLMDLLNKIKENIFGYDFITFNYDSIKYTGSFTKILSDILNDFEEREAATLLCLGTFTMNDTVIKED